MPRVRTSIALGLLVAAVVAARAVRPVKASAVSAELVTTSPNVGPIEVTPPKDAVFAHDAAELVALVKNGPAEIWLEAKAYPVELVVERAVTLKGLRGATLEGSKTGTVLTLKANGAAIENVVVRGSGHRFTTEDGAIHAKGDGIAVRHVKVEEALFGVSFEACTHCTLEDSHVVGEDVALGIRGDGIKVWESHDSIIRRNRVERVRDMVVWYSRRVLCEDNVITGSRYGTHFMYAHDGVVRRSKMVGDIVGVFVMYSQRLHVEDNVLAGAHGAAGVGIGFKESDGVAVTGNALVGNTAGIYLDRTPRSPDEPVHFEKNRIAVNDLALRVHGTESGITFAGNEFAQNGGLIEVDGGGDALKMAFVGNRWSEYDGYDLDGDGIGDVPFVFKQLSSEISEEHPDVRFLHGTVAMGMVDAIAHAFPVLSQKPVLVDERPVLDPMKAGWTVVPTKAAKNP